MLRSLESPRVDNFLPSWDTYKILQASKMVPLKARRALRARAAE